MPRTATLAAALLICSGALADIACAQSVMKKIERDEIALVARGDPAMAAAVREARATLDDFLKLKKKPRPSITSFAVKVGVHEGQETEFFWVNPFEWRGSRYQGRLNNTPRTVKNVKHGDTITFKKSEIIDWTYTENGQMKGNYTACAILRKEAQAERDAFKKKFGLDCTFY